MTLYKGPIKQTWATLRSKRINIPGFFSGLMGLEKIAIGDDIELYSISWNEETREIVVKMGRRLGNGPSIHIHYYKNRPGGIWFYVGGFLSYNSLPENLNTELKVISVYPGVIRMVLPPEDMPVTERMKFVQFEQPHNAIADFLKAQVGEARISREAARRED